MCGTGLLSELRKTIGYVPQETFLFSETIRENIAFGSHSGMTDSEVDWAARVSQIAEDIETFARKWRHMSESAASPFPAARSSEWPSAELWRPSQNPDIRRFTVKCRHLHGRTDSGGAHQSHEKPDDYPGVPSNLHRRKAHQIIVLKEGAVVERGTHESLMALQGVYADLYRKQLLEEELASCTG